MSGWGQDKKGVDKFAYYQIPPTPRLMLVMAQMCVRRHVEDPEDVDTICRVLGVDDDSIRETREETSRVSLQQGRG